MKKLDFNRGWSVRKDGTDICRTVNLPHDAMLAEERSKDSPTAGAGGYFMPGKYYYTKSFEAPDDWRGQAVILECEGVYQNAEVYLNDVKLNEHPYGYTQFFTDLTEHLAFDRPNELKVVADNADAPNSRWYSGSGMYRPAWLYVGHKAAIAPEGIRVTVLDPDRIRVDVDFLSSTPAEPAVHIDILENLSGGTIVAETAENHDVITVPGARLWSAETPNLYRVRVTASLDGEVIDCAEDTFGFRTLKWSGEGLFVNGQETLLRGACIHHDNGILGAACFADAEERRVRILKEAGFNAIRSAHNPVSKAMLKACDELGMYMMDESFDMWFIQKNPYDYGKHFPAWWKADIKAMVSKDVNHPSVIMYSIGNEISDLGQERGQNMCGEMAGYVRSLDSTRPTTLGINLMLATLVSKGKGLYGNGKEGEESSGMGSQAMDNMPTSTFFNVLMNRAGGIMELTMATPGADKVAESLDGTLDMPGYNYAAPRYRKEAKTHPERPFVGSETLPKALYHNWQLVKKIPQLTGDFMWTGWDYLGEAGIGTVRYTDPQKKNEEPALIILGGPGVIDICGFPRAEVNWNKSIWGLRSEPAIAVEPYTHANHRKGISMWRNTDAIESWSWTGCEGSKSDVMIYSDAAVVELFVNGKSMGKRKPLENKATYKNVQYLPGQIKAVAYGKTGAKIGESTLMSETGRTEIKVSPDKLCLKANGRDLAFLEIGLVGMNGIIKAFCDKTLTVTVEGAGTLQAFGSARPDTRESFLTGTYTTYYGKALAAVRAGFEPGEITVTIKGENLEETSLTITVE